jgi:uncharacterized protein
LHENQFSYMKSIFSIILALSIGIISCDKRTETLLPKESSITNNKIQGTLLSTDSADKLVIIVAGSGPTDRNGNNPLGVISDAYKQLADSLILADIATFRYDKRGVGASAAALVDQSKTSFNDLVTDVVDWVRFFQNQSKWKSIYIVGHSEGSLMGILAAQQVQVNGLISLAGAGQNIEHIVLQQSKNNGATTLQLNEIAAKFDTLKQNLPIKYVPDYLKSLFHPDIQLYIKTWNAYQPSEELKKLDFPISIINGTTDAQVDIAEAELLHKAKPSASLFLINNMTHTLKIGDNKVGNNTYTNPKLPLAPELIKNMKNFLKK